jgi:ElaB/YqjD/DUF883 family membrane-anchored ribosome-binding protein
MDAAGEKLIKEFRDVVAAAEELLGASAAGSNERFRDLRGRTEEQIRAHPLAAVGIAAGIGLVVGVLLARK